jgi:hypothetical protein
MEIEDTFCPFELSIEGYRDAVVEAKGFWEIVRPICGSFLIIAFQRCAFSVWCSKGIWSIYLVEQKTSSIRPLIEYELVSSAFLSMQLILCSSLQRATLIVRLNKDHVVFWSSLFFVFLLHSLTWYISITWESKHHSSSNGWSSLGF